MTTKDPATETAGGIRRSAGASTPWPARSVPARTRAEERGPALPRRGHRADEGGRLGQGLHGPGGRRALGSVVAQLLPVLRRASTSCCSRCSRSRCARRRSACASRSTRRTIRSSASTSSSSSTTGAAVPPAGARPRRRAPTDPGHGRLRPAAADRAPGRGGDGVRAARRRCSTSCSTPPPRPVPSAPVSGNGPIAGVVLEAIMFNAFSVTIGERPAPSTRPRSCGT